MRVAFPAVALIAASVSAQQPVRDSSRIDSVRAPQALNAVVVTASQRPQHISDAPVTTQLISRAEIDRSGAQDLHALLTRYVGVQPEPSVAGSGGVQIEGLSSQRVLLLIDGQPMVGRIDGELDVSRVPTWMVDHVEVIKGPLATLYGSSAMGGVINVITRSAFGSTPIVNAAATGGSQGRVDASASVQGAIGDTRVIVGGGRRENNIQPGRADQSAAESNRWDGNAKVRWAPQSGSMSIEGSALAVREDQRWQSGQLYFFSNNDQSDAQLTVLSGELALTGHYSRFDHLSRQSTLPRPVSDSGDQSTESLGRLQATYRRELSAQQRLDAGLAVDRGELTGARILGGGRTTTSIEPYAQYSIETARVSIVPGLRASYSDQWGAHFTPKLATLLRLSSDVTLRASAGAGYRAPDFKELYITFLNANVGYVVHGNPDLRPEMSINETLALEWSHRSAFARVQGYNNDFSQFIEPVSAPDSSGLQQFTYGNVGRGVSRGVDVDAGWTVGRYSLDGSYGYLHAYDRDTRLALLGTTPQSARLSLDVGLPWRMRSSVTGLYWSETSSAFVNTAQGTTTIDRGAWARMDAQLAKSLADGIELRAGTTNLLNSRPFAWPGPTARQWYVGGAIARPIP